MKVNYGLSDEAVGKIVGQLKKILANTHVLYVKTLFCHWNLEDSRFQFLHELFEDQYTALAEATDTIAERIRIMGHVAPGSLRDFRELTTLTELSDPVGANDMIALLSEDHEASIHHLRDAIGLCEEHGDAGTADMLTDLLRDHEKTAWFLRSHL